MDSYSLIVALVCSDHGRLDPLYLSHLLHLIGLTMTHQWEEMCHMKSTLAIVLCSIELVAAFPAVRMLILGGHGCLWCSGSMYHYLRTTTW